MEYDNQSFYTGNAQGNVNDIIEAVQPKQKLFVITLTLTKHVTCYVLEYVIGQGKEIDVTSIEGN